MGYYNKIAIGVDLSDASYDAIDSFFKEFKEISINRHKIRIAWWDKKLYTFFVGKLECPKDFFENNYEEVINEIGRRFLLYLKEMKIDPEKQVKNLYVSEVAERENLIYELEAKPEFEKYLKSKTYD